MSMKQELIAKAKEAKSVEELLAVAKECGVELTEDAAKEFYERFHATGELSDDELDAVAGGDDCGPGYIVTYISPTSTCINGKFIGHSQTIDKTPRCENCSNLVRKIVDGAPDYYGRPTEAYFYYCKEELRYRS